MSYRWQCTQCKVVHTSNTTKTPDGWSWRMRGMAGFFVFCRRCISGALDAGTKVEPST